MTPPAAANRSVSDQMLTDIAAYVCNFEIKSADAYKIARYCLMDALGCGFAALNFPACTKLLAPSFPGMTSEYAARVPGTSLELDPVSAAFSIGTLVRWLDYNDALAALTGGHPSDNLGAILAVADHLGRKRSAEGAAPPLMRDVLTAMIKAYEIQGLFSLENDIPKLGFDHVALVRVASTAVAAQMLGGDRAAILNAVALAWADGFNLNVHRQGKNTASRKSWAGGDSTSRAVRLAVLALRGEQGAAEVFSAKNYGVHDAFMKGEPLKQPRTYGSHIIEHALAFKFIPAGMQGQSAGECAFGLHPLVKDCIDDIESITIRSHRRMMQIMDKKGPLANPAARDHCAQYLIAVGLIHGKIDATDFSDEFAADPRIDRLREKMTVLEEPRYTREFHDPAKHSNAHAIEVCFRDGSRTPNMEVEFPSGHPPLRAADFSLVEKKFQRHMAPHFSAARQAEIVDLFSDQARFEALPAHEFMSRLAI